MVRRGSVTVSIMMHDARNIHFYGDKKGNRLQPSEPYIIRRENFVYVGHPMLLSGSFEMENSSPTLQVCHGDFKREN